uniref:C2H2-type domain-containing protein n=1 Tax=Ditylenchus dipsaci TaxID=166011 RepID=A0A915EN89_9BILA
MPESQEPGPPQIVLSPMLEKDEGEQSPLHLLNAAIAAAAGGGSSSSQAHSRASSVLSGSSSSGGQPSSNNSLLFLPYPHKERKRRRVIGNMDNTLDGLVAKRAELDSLSQKRYQTETEAIELPDDELEIKRMETDPDVSTRMCSVCGYQGKWVSEMIRHKRVHTNDRPFKCKYCNRTSKWKADLIRHVAKTHGIRVVSKYSRSKAFDGNGSDGNSKSCSYSPSHISSSQDENNNKSVIRLAQANAPQAFPLGSASASLSCSNSPSLTAFRCMTCLFEQESIEVLIDHLHNVHNVSPFECSDCKGTFEELQAASSHCSLPASVCTPLAIKVNFSPVYSNNGATTAGSNTLKPPTSLSTSSSLSACNTTGSSPVGSLLSELDAHSSSSTSSSSSLCGQENALSIQIDGQTAKVACKECPFRAVSMDKLQAHLGGHDTPKSALHYKCVFCNWHAKKKSSIESHLQVHTSRPQDFMGEVEQKFNAKLKDAEAAKALFNVTTTNSSAFCSPAQIEETQRRNIAAASLQHQQQQLALLSMLYANNTMGSQQLPVGPMSQVVSGTPGLPDLAVLQQIASNPLLAFGLCSLLEMRHKKSSELLNSNTKLDQML